MKEDYMQSSGGDESLDDDGFPVDHNNSHHDDNHPDSSNDNVTRQRRRGLFHHMAAFPWPYLVALPVAFAILIGLGWSQDDIVEQEVAAIWIPTRGQLARDTAYAASLERDEFGATSLAAMAIARDGQNLMTEERLAEITARMQQAEAATITYKNIEFTWDDVCLLNNLGPGTAYKFPCARLSPMDFFQEARWYFDKDDKRTWYQGVVQQSLIQPRLPRFGVLSTACSSQPSSAFPQGSPTPSCDKQMALRTNPQFAVEQGYPAEYANPLLLFADVGNLGMYDRCRICIEENYTRTIDQLHTSALQTFGALYSELQQSVQAVHNDPRERDIAAITARVGLLATTMTRADVEDFYFYYVARNVYATLGTPTYLRLYMESANMFAACNNPLFPDLICPPTSIDIAEARRAMFAHADNVFSSVTTAGAPFPIWSKGDGTGTLFGGSEPVGGSGVNMSQSLNSVATYLDATNLARKTEEGEWNPLYDNGVFADPTSDDAWEELVEPNPFYAWFMASLEPAEHVCGNGVLPGANLGIPAFDAQIDQAMAAASQLWCTEYTIPNTNDPGPQDKLYTKQHFARMWYDLLVVSDGFLGVTQGQDDAYTWTLGLGCGLTLGGERDPYTNRTEEEILQSASGELYFIDEGATLGAVDRSLLMGGTVPAMGQYSYENPLKEVTVLQTIYAALTAKLIPHRVRNCNRPGGPVEITEEDAKEVLKLFKESMEEKWNQGWDDGSNGQVQFVSFFDDSGAIGTTGRMLTDITLDSGTLTAVSIIVILVFSSLFLCNKDLVKSQVLITMVGVGLVVLAYFAAVGFGILVGIKVNITIAWTLPFIIIGLGVDDMYIVLLAMKKQGDYSEESFLKAMRETVVPVTMTSLVNGSMYALMNVSDVPAVYLTAQVAVASVVALYLTVILCFPAYLYLDMKRQEAGRWDLLVCQKSENKERKEDVEDFRNKFLFDYLYKPVVLAENIKIRALAHIVIWLGTGAFLACGIYGITQREIGLGLEDFFPEWHPANRWATVRTEELASWTVAINWGANDYTSPDEQLKMIQQFESIVATPHIAEIDTNQLWISNLLIWSSRHCSENVQKSTDTQNCGMDQLYADNTYCSGKWRENAIQLRTKKGDDPSGDCEAFQGGICLPGAMMHPDDLSELGISKEEAEGKSYCPVIEDWSDEKWQFCMQQWRNATGFTGGAFLFDSNPSNSAVCEGEFNNDQELRWPIPFSAGPTMFAIGLTSHDKTLDLLSDTRVYCDDDPENHCYMTGIPFNYWSQYEHIFETLAELAGYSTAIGFAVAFAFLFVKLLLEKNHPARKIFLGSLVGALLIALTIIMSLVSVIGLSILIDVSVTGFSLMSFVLSAGFAVEYSVHIVSRWLRADMSKSSSVARVEHTMSFLMLPTFMSFVSSTIGVVCLAFTDFEFNKTFFFKPLIVVMFVTYFFGCWWLPTLLSYLDFDFLKLGNVAEEQALMFSKHGGVRESANWEGEPDDSKATESSAIAASKSQAAPPVEAEVEVALGTIPLSKTISF